jgi:peroxin-3
MSDQENEEMSRREVYIFIQQNSFATVTKLLVQLKETVNQHLNTEAITSQIRNNPTNKMALWESLKSSSFSRAVVCGCVSSMVGMMVRVQLSVIAGYRCCQGDGLTNERQTAYLSIMYRSFEKNLPDLVSIISTAADSILSTYSLKHQVTLEFILELFNHIMEQANHTQRSCDIE